MEHPAQVDPKILNRYLTWQGFASVLIWLLCVGVAAAPDTSERTAVVLAAGATIYVIIAFGSGFWTGYTREYRKTTTKEESLASLLKPASFLSFATILFIFNFSNGYFIAGEDLLRALYRGLFIGAGTAGGLYLFVLLTRKKKN